MQCPRCGSVAHPGQKFCEQCGTPLPENVGAGAMSVAPSTENAALALVGRTVAGKYKVVKLLGEGGMGCVYVAEQSMGTTTRKVALKTLHLELSSDPKIRARFEREVATVAHLEHPNTIKVFDFGTAEAGMLYIVMELAVGRTLADLLEKEGALDPDRAAKILTQVCGSLEEAHAHGIIHRDLKPENIMLVERLGQKDVVKVLDFGIAKNRDEENRGAKLTQQGTVLGTPPYMSPEQFTGAALDVRSDIYSLGVVAYEMLTGRLPFEAASAFEWATLHMTSQPRPIEEQPMGSRVPVVMREAVHRALRKIPSERFASITEFAAALTTPVAQRTAKTATDVAAADPASVLAARPGGTLMGEPVDPAVFAAPPASPPVHATPQHYPPEPYRVGPAPYAAPQPAMQAYRAPPQEERSSRAPLLALLSLVAVLLVGGVVWGLVSYYEPGSSGGNVPVVVPPTPQPTPDTPSSNGPSTPDPPSGTPTLATPTVRPPTPQPTNNKPPTPQPTLKPPTPQPTPVTPTPVPTPVTPTPVPTPVTPTPIPTPVTPRPTGVDPCVKAAEYKQKNNPVLYARYAQLCRDTGRIPP